MCLDGRERDQGAREALLGLGGIGGAAELPKRKARPLSVLDVRQLGPEDYLAGTVRLSNKGCPRYYSAFPFAWDPDAPDAPPKRCGCPKGQCWYDAQHARRAKVQLALTHEAWLALVTGKARE